MSEVRCAYCHGELEGEEQTQCQACQAPHHLDCWAASSGCSACFHSRCNHPDEVREIARSQRRERWQQAREERSRQRRGGLQSWTSFIFVVEIILAFLVVLLGLIQGHAWVIVAYVAQGTALALFFAFSDGEEPARQEAPRRRRRRRRSAPPPPDVSVADGVFDGDGEVIPAPAPSLSERIRIRRVSAPADAPTDPLPTLMDGDGAAAAGSPFGLPPNLGELSAPLPELPFQADPLPPGLWFGEAAGAGALGALRLTPGGPEPGRPAPGGPEPGRPAPGRPGLPPAHAQPIRLEQIFHPRFDELGADELISNVRSEAEDLDEDDDDEDTKTLYRRPGGGPGGDFGLG